MEHDIPFLFAGSNRLSALILQDEIIGWGKPDASYFFQLWRDIPSHVISFRNKLDVDFLQSFTDNPPVKINSDSVKYDFIISGEVPDGSLVQFTATIQDSIPKLQNILVKQYSSHINDLIHYKLTDDSITINPQDFLILLTNLGSSTGKDDILDLNNDNVLVGSDDIERRKFNENYYSMYFNLVKTQLVEKSSFLERFINLSGVHILSYMVDNDDQILDLLINRWDDLTEMAHPALHILILETKLGEYDMAKKYLQQLGEEMRMIQSLRPSFFMNTV